MTSLMYKFPILYNLFLKIVHVKNLSKRYEEIAKIIGKNKKVLDLGCGTCLLHKFLDKSCKYEGWDLNEKFINKNKHLNVKLKNIFDYKNYPKNDVIVILDVLHHVIPHHEKIIKNTKTRTKKLIILEPYVNITTNNKILEKMLKFWDKILGDDDGINNYENRRKWFNKKEDVLNFFKKFKPKMIKEIGWDYLVVI